MAIHINPKNKGKFNALKKRTGKTTEQLKHSKNPLTRKRATFAANAKKWKHADGGLVQYPEGGTITNPKKLSNINVYGTKDKSTDAQMNSISGKNYPELFNIPQYEAMWSSWADNGRPKINSLNETNSPYGKGRAYYLPSNNEMFIRSGVTKDYMAELAHARQVVDGTFKLDTGKYPTTATYEKAYSDPTSNEYNAHSVIEPELKKKYNVKYPYGGTLSAKDMTANKYANTIQQTQKSAAGLIPGANIFSSLGGTAADLIDSKDEYGVSKSDWGSGIRGAIDPSMSLSRGIGDIASGKVDWGTAADWAFPIAGELLQNSENKKQRQRAMNPNQPQPFINPGYTATFPMGGIIPNAQPNVELEKNEVLQGADGSAVQVNAPSHAQGGIDLAAAGGGRVFSDRIINPETGNTFAEDAAKLLKQMKKK
jgi:hypothetical protein